MYENRNGIDIYYYYDSLGTPTSIKYYEPDGTNYRFYLATNQLGDIIGIYNASGNMVVKYEYDAWGNILKTTNANGDSLNSLSQKWSDINPFRYRGYYYDSEIGLYYLQSRYYDAETGRFLNADSQLNTSLGVLGCNMFAYCLNNPLNKVDYGGNRPGDLFDTMDEAARDAALTMSSVSFENNWEYAASIYYVNKLHFEFNWVTKSVSFLWFDFEYKSLDISVKLVTKYTYDNIVTDEESRSVVPPDVPKGKTRVAAVHTHPLGSGRGVTEFSQQDIDWAEFYSIPVYVYGPNGELKKYHPNNSNVDEDKPVFSDLPRHQ